MSTQSSGSQHPCRHQEGLAKHFEGRDRIPSASCLEEFQNSRFSGMRVNEEDTQREPTSGLHMSVHTCPEHLHTRNDTCINLHTQMYTTHTQIYLPSQNFYWRFTNNELSNCASTGFEFCESNLEGQEEGSQEPMAVHITASGPLCAPSTRAGLGNSPLLEGTNSGISNHLSL